MGSTSQQIREQTARAMTIRQAIMATERELLRDLKPREREDVMARLATLRALLRMVR